MSASLVTISHTHPGSKHASELQDLLEQLKIHLASCHERGFTLFIEGHPCLFATIGTGTHRHVVGFAYLSHKRGVWWVDGIAIDQHWHNQGLIEKLLRESITAATKKHGAHLVYMRSTDLWFPRHIIADPERYYLYTTDENDVLAFATSLIRHVGIIKEPKRTQQKAA